jgi:NADH dehydrogenase [ubiquinone] 1 alpha subcomplex assembly factor 6
MQHQKNIIRDIIQTQDSDRFFLTLLEPFETHESIWALLAFYYETARTREMVTDTTIGLIRLQWWKDSIRQFYEQGYIPPHDVMIAVCEAIKRYDLPHEFFQEMLIAREFDIEDRVPSNMDGLLNYIRLTQIPLYKLIQIVIGDTSSDIRLIAEAYGLIGLLRAFVFHARQRRCYLPADRIGNIEDIYVFKNIELLKPLVKEICERAKDNLNQFQSDHKFFKGMKYLTILYLKQIEHVDYNVISPELLVPPKFKQLRVWFGSL